MGPNSAGVVFLAALAIAPLQDLLNLGAEARMNLPGQRGRQLALALHRRNVVRAGFRPLAGVDDNVGPLCIQMQQSKWRRLHYDTEFNCFSSRFQQHITRPGQSSMGSIRYEVTR